MWHRQFESMGTLWQVTIDSDAVSNNVEQQIYQQSHHFDNQFSRFIENSEANTFRNSSAGTYTVSAEFALLLQFAQKLQKQTNNRFNPAIGGLLEAAGYDAEYCFRADQQRIESWQAPIWNITNDQLTINGPVVFDIGGYGKGYWIDQLAHLLKKSGNHHFLVDGGRDMYGSTKKSGQPWKIAIEKPGDSKKAVATVALKNQGLAISDVFKRQWGEWHHTLDPQQKKPTSQLVGCSVIAKNAMIADGLSTCLSLISLEQGKQLAKKYNASFIALTSSSIFTSSKASDHFNLL